MSGHICCANFSFSALRALGHFGEDGDVSEVKHHLMKDVQSMYSASERHHHGFTAVKDDHT